jgi:3-dehydroquinate synthase
METLHVALGERSYPIHIGAGLIGNGTLLENEISAQQILIVSNEVVAPLYLGPVEKALGARELHNVILPDGEQHKTLDSFSTVIDALVSRAFHRDACIVALGGGVVGDIAGFAASCYQRGIDYVQIPTTLLAQVDSSVGGKTAVNHSQAKNMIGAFHQPVSVITDTEALKTLPARELAAGLAEVIKYGLILDERFFEWQEEHIDALLALDGEALRFAIRRSCELKATIVAQDEREHGRRALLNFGHTFGHALESLGGYGRWLHGEAVAIGMSLAMRTSCSLGWISDSDCARVDSLLRRANLPVTFEGVDVDRLRVVMQLDKKARAEGLKLVLLRRIGEGTVAQAPSDSVLADVIGERAGN